MDTPINIRVHPDNPASSDVRVVDGSGAVVLDQTYPTAEVTAALQLASECGDSLDVFVAWLRAA